MQLLRGGSSGELSFQASAQRDCGGSKGLQEVDRAGPYGHFLATIA